METTKEVIKYIAVLVALPWVLPFLRALVKDLLQAFEEDGGLLGDPPVGEHLKKLREEKARRPDPLVSEPLAHVRAQERERPRG